MSAVALQIAIMVGVFGSLIWLATRRSRRGARRTSGDGSWSGDTVYSMADGGSHDGAGGTDSGASGGSGDSGGGDSGGGGGDGGGGGGSD